MAELPMVIIMTNDHDDHDDLGNNYNHDEDDNKIITNLRRLASWSSGMKEDVQCKEAVVANM